MKNKNLGKEAIDKISGFRGTVTGFAQYVTGCDQYLLTPKTDDDKKKPDSHWFDSNRLDYTHADAIVLETREEKGACEAAPIK